MTDDRIPTFWESWSESSEVLMSVLGYIGPWALLIGIVPALAVIRLEWKSRREDRQKGRRR